MRPFTCLFKDRRYSIATLSFLFADDEQAALELASREFSANANDLSFEVCDGGRALFTGARQDVGAPSAACEHSA